jgi:hypothetical protein
MFLFLKDGQASMSEIAIREQKNRTEQDGTIDLKE